MGINEYMLAQHFDVRRACWVSAELIFVCLFVCFWGVVCWVSGSSLLLLALFFSCSEQEPLSSCGAWAFHCSGLSRCKAQALGCSGFGRHSSWAPEHWFSTCGTWAQLLPRGPGIKPMSPALAGRFAAPEPPGKPMLTFLPKNIEGFSVGKGT